jgi:hypothetical protein
MFTYDVQHGGDSLDKYELKGQTDYDNFMLAFEAFPWIDEIERSNANPNGSSPTLSVKNETDNKDLWVSMAGDRNNHGYLIGYVYLKPKKRILGFGKLKTIKWVEIYLTVEKQLIVNLFKIYFDKDYDRLYYELRKLEKFGESKAVDS